MDLFEAKNVVKAYANHLALDDVSIRVPENSIFGLLGPNGAGKTTLIRIINQITAPDKGSLLFDGRKLKAEDVNRIGYLPEERGLYKKMKVGEQALYLVQLKGIKKNDALRSLKYWFEKFEIQAWWDKKVEELSKGMQQKVQFIITVLHKPKLLIFDEPFSGFDPINANLVKQEILKLKEEGSTIIFSTHNMGSVEELCDHITLINKSKSILEGEINDIRSQFKPDTFHIAFKGDEIALKESLNDSVSFENQKKVKDVNHLDLRFKNGLKTRDLISKINPIVELVSFEEVMPSINDIFIRVVEETNAKNN